MIAARPAVVDEAALQAAALEERYRGAESHELLAAMIGEAFPGTLAVVSSFGIEAAVILHMAAAIDPAVPVIFLDTGKLFGETQRYRRELTAKLGLRDVRIVHPDEAAISAADPDGVLWRDNPDLCCRLRKVEPLQRALAGFDAWVTGRKRYQGGLRTALPLVEASEGRIKINPLAGWSRQQIEAYFETAGLPRHPLEEDGYLSVGCMPCTDRIAPGEDARDGRWRGRGKTECGIHLPAAAGVTRELDE